MIKFCHIGNLHVINLLIMVMWIYTLALLKYDTYIITFEN